MLDYTKVKKSAFDRAYKDDMKGYQSLKGRLTSVLNSDLTLSELDREKHERNILSKEYVSTKQNGFFAHEGKSYRWNASTRAYEVGFGATKAYVVMNKCRSNSTLTGNHFKMPENQTLLVRFDSPGIFAKVVKAYAKEFGTTQAQLKKRFGVHYVSRIPSDEIVAMLSALEKVPSSINGVEVPIPKFNRQYMAALKGRVARGLIVPQTDALFQKHLTKADDLQKDKNRIDAPAFSAVETSRRDELPVWALERLNA